MKAFLETAAKKWFALAWKDKVCGAFTYFSSFSGDKLNTLLGDLQRVHSLPWNHQSRKSLSRTQ